AYIGPCRVATDHLVDWEDRIKGDRIEAKWMLHIQGEFFGPRLREAVLLQRLLVASVAESLNDRRISRRGNDLFALDRKLSVSIVTASPVSCLLHLGINIDPEGAPVPAVGLTELGLMPETWLPALLDRVASEFQQMDWACAKVRPVV
ncbi:MAG: DUF366 family protein, partial [Bdellovibrionota bacterium]